MLDRDAGRAGWRLQITSADLSMIMADATRTDQALFNPIENALLHGVQADVALSA
jgi:hypothetical protein